MTEHLAGTYRHVCRHHVAHYISSPSLSVWTGYLDNCLSLLSAGLFFAFDLFFTNADKLNKLLQKLNCRQTIVDGCEIIFQQMRTLF